MSDEEPAGVLDVLRRGTPRSAGTPSCYGRDDLSVPSFGEVAPFGEQDIEVFRYEPDGVAEDHQQLARSGSAVDGPVEPPVEPFEGGAVAVGPGLLQSLQFDGEVRPPAVGRSGGELAGEEGVGSVDVLDVLAAGAGHLEGAVGPGLHEAFGGEAEQRRPPRDPSYRPACRPTVPGPDLAKHE